MFCVPTAPALMWNGCTDATNTERTIAEVVNALVAQKSKAIHFGMAIAIFRSKGNE